MPFQPTSFWDILLQFLPYIFGTGGFIAFYIAWKTKKSVIKQAEASTLESIDAIYEKMTNQVSKQFDKMQKNITDLENKLDEYVKQCSECSFNKIQKRK